MIAPNWILEDLDPVSWRAIGRFFLPDQYIAAAQPGEHGLFVLHHAGKGPRVVDTVRGLRTDLAINQVENPRKLVAELYARGEWDRVHVIDKHHLGHVSAEAQSTPRRELSVDAYYHLVYQLLWDGSDGYVCEPPPAGNWHGLTYSALSSFLRRAPTPSTVALCVPGSIGLVLCVEHGRIVRATTFEALPALPEPSVTPEFLETLWQNLAAPYAVLVCTPAAWEAALAAPNLVESLRTAEALWRLADDNDAYTGRV